MKRFFLLFGMLAVVTAGLSLLPPTARAISSPMTSEHIERIRANCVEAQGVLRRLHASDALLRVNRGQLYELMATKLMAPFNSRVALNRLDGTRLVTVSSDYERQLDSFRDNYQAYEEAMAAALDIDCVSRPVAFYDGVHDAHAKRQKVHDSTQQLNRSITKYKEEFEALAKQIEKSEQ